MTLLSPPETFHTDQHLVEEASPRVQVAKNHISVMSHRQAAQNRKNDVDIYNRTELLQSFLAL